MANCLLSLLPEETLGEFSITQNYVVLRRGTDLKNTWVEHLSHYVKAYF